MWIVHTERMCNGEPRPTFGPPKPQSPCTKYKRQEGESPTPRTRASVDTCVFTVVTTSYFDTTVGLSAHRDLEECLRKENRIVPVNYRLHLGF